MDTLRTELIESQKVRSDLLKWKLLIIAGVGGAALGFSGSSGPTDAHLALAVLPIACAYVDLLCRHLSLRNKAIGLFFEHTSHSTPELKQYETFYADLSSSCWKYSLESVALLGLTVFVSIIVIPVGILAGGEQNWKLLAWPASLFYGSGFVGLTSAVSIQLWYHTLKRRARDSARNLLTTASGNAPQGATPVGDSRARGGPPSVSKPPNTDLPLPVVTGAIGLLIATTLPGGLSGGQGFLVGLGIGLAILTIADHQQRVARERRREVRCPECGTIFDVSSSSTPINQTGGLRNE